MKDNKKNKQPSTHDPSKMPHNTPRKSNMGKDPQDAEIENPDQNDQPEIKTTIDDDPEQTKRKVPNMQK